MFWYISDNSWTGFCTCTLLSFSSCYGDDDYEYGDGDDGDGDDGDGDEGAPQVVPQLEPSDTLVEMKPVKQTVTYDSSTGLMLLSLSWSLHFAEVTEGNGRRT